MRYPLILLAVVSLFAAAQAEMVAVVASPEPTPMMSTMPATEPVCTFTAADLPQPCPVIASSPLSGRSTVLVLGTQERYALSNAPVSHLGWYDFSENHMSYFAPGNPMTSYRPSPVVTRHGNPFMPYHQVSARLRPAEISMNARMVPLPDTLSEADRNSLVALSARYRMLTPDQARALGYVAQGTCSPGTGQLYLNPGLVDNRVDPMNPEGFYFSADGRVLAAVYLVSSATPVTLYGQTTSPSTIATGAQQMTVWVFDPNPNGMFAALNPNTKCTVL